MNYVCEENHPRSGFMNVHGPLSDQGARGSNLGKDTLADCGTDFPLGNDPLAAPVNNAFGHGSPIVAKSTVEIGHHGFHGHFSISNGDTAASVPG